MRKTSIATVCLSGSLDQKIDAIARAGFDGIELPRALHLARAGRRLPRWGVEVTPSASGDEMPLHCVLIRDMGMPLGEMFVLDELAAVASELGTATFHLSCAGLRVPGAVGSPVSPVVTI